MTTLWILAIAVVVFLALWLVARARLRARARAAARRQQAIHDRAQEDLERLFEAAAPEEKE